MWPSPQEIPDLVTFTEQIPNRIVNFVCSVSLMSVIDSSLCKITQAAFTCSKLTIETLEQGMKYVPC